MSHHASYPSVITVVSPLIHSDERVEVMQRFRREPFRVGGEILDVPVYSGNAIRGMLRRAAAATVCEQTGIGERTLPVDSFYLLFSGGILRGSDHAYRVEDYRRLRALLPPVGLLGGSWGSRIMHGLVDVWRAVPVCVELAPLHGDHPAYQGDVPSAFDLLTEVSYTRRDDRAEENDGPSEVQMRYTFEALVPGTLLLHGCVVRTTDPLLVGCLADAVARSDGVPLGGRGAIGHGHTRWDWTGTIAAAHADQADGYRAHLADHAGEIRALLGVVEG